MLLRVDPQSPEPLSEQIVFGVKDAVAAGELAPGDRLPSVRELARRLTVNPNTVSRAYGRLEAEGVIVRRQGAGCFVTGRPSALNDEERERRLRELFGRAVTEAFHLGFDAAAIRAAVRERIAEIQFKRSS